MPTYRYDKEFNNDIIEYQFLLDDRDLDVIRQYGTKTFNTDLLKRPMRAKRHVIIQGDKLYKLANRYYNDFSYWWVIALFNKIASDVDLKYGQIIYIPLDISDILGSI